MFCCSSTVMPTVADATGGAPCLRASAERNELVCESFERCIGEGQLPAISLASLRYDLPGCDAWDQVDDDGIGYLGYKSPGGGPKRSGATQDVSLFGRRTERRRKTFREFAELAQVLGLQQCPRCKNSSLLEEGGPPEEAVSLLDDGAAQQLALRTCIEYKGKKHFSPFTELIREFVCHCPFCRRDYPGGQWNGNPSEHVALKV